MSLIGAREHQFLLLNEGGDTEAVSRTVAEEVPVAIEVNGLGYAVLMATPADLLDLAYGFLFSERLIDRAANVTHAEAHQLNCGQLLRVVVVDEVAERLRDRVRHRTSDSSCGLCGVENIEQALRPLPQVPCWSGDDRAVFTALAEIDAWQSLGRETRAVHAAAASARDGSVRSVREDVGRHNAFDKLIGGMLRTGATWDGGFALLTSRCSYELVEKAALARCPMLATISAPTGLALDRAMSAGLALRVVARPDALLATVDELYVSRTAI